MQFSLSPRETLLLADACFPLAVVEAVSRDLVAADGVLLGVSEEFATACDVKGDGNCDAAWLDDGEGG